MQEVKIEISDSLSRIYGLDQPRRILIRTGKPTIALPPPKLTKKQKRLEKMKARQARNFNQDRQNALNRMLGITKPRSKSRHRPDLVASRNFYSSREWLGLRYEVLLKYGRTCMCCGVEAKPPHVDHIKPRSKHPHLELDINNLQVLCHDCNMGKSNVDETDWRKA